MNNRQLIILMQFQIITIQACLYQLEKRGCKFH